MSEDEIRAIAKKIGVEDTDKDNKIWTVSNRDPYDVRVTNSTNSQSLYDNSECHLIIMSSTATNPEDGQVVLLLANQADLSNISNSQSIALSGSTITKAQMDRSAAGQQVIFSEAVLERTYRLIDKQGKILLEYSSNDLGSDKDKLGVPAEWRSPLIKYKPVTSSSDYVKDSNGEYSGYKYWVRSNFNISGDTYTLKTEQKPINGPAQSTDSYIYVTYDVDDSRVQLSVVDPTKKTHRNGDVSEPFVRTPEEFGKMYMLKFHDGEKFNMERSDAVESTKEQAVYPYTNGDAGLFVYSEERWGEQKNEGASTRTRWAWYFASPTNDPYHVTVTSWQSTHNRKLDGDDVNTNFYNYLRTYYNTTLRQVVTGSTTDDPRALSTIPVTEYMILGTTSNYQLLTVNAINDGSTTERRYVKNFEHYWKNNPTINNLLEAGGKSKITTPETYEESIELSADQKAVLTARGWHEYSAWANAAPWKSWISDDDNNGKSGKQYRNKNHWYQTINMDTDGDGVGTFDIVEHSIDGVLILLDQHGWEIVRKPMTKTGDPRKTENDKKIQAYDSPMVKQYYFYKITSDQEQKVKGYHKYILRADDKQGSGTSLTDYPEVLNTNNNLIDLYVTYDVKDEYKNAYQGADKDHATDEGTVQFPFLIRQDGNLAQATSATTLSTVTVESKGIDTGSPTGIHVDTNADLYWYLKPNFIIDEEMGYKYKGDPQEAEEAKTKEEMEKEYINSGTTHLSNGFDPYNIQIYNKQYTNGYFTTNATHAEHDGAGGWQTTDASKTVSLTTKASLPATNGTTYDSKPIYMTNQTFMAVQDANGNMRLMPRFDQNHVIENFTTLKDLAGKQPESDKSHGQSTWLLRPTVYTYKVIDNLGREALQYKSLSSGSPLIPAMFKSPLAKDFKFYATLLDENEDGSYELNTLNNEITGSFADATGITENTVYVRYSYNPDADIDGLLKGTWYHAKLNDADVEVATTGVIKKSLGVSPSDEEKKAHRWRFMQSAGDDSDPYAVSLYNGSKETESPAVHYILMKHSSGTGYALMQAGNTTDPTTKYYFLDGTSAPTLAAQSNYITGTAEPFTPAGTIDASKKLTLVPVLATDKLTYNIITHSGKVALTEENVAVSDESVLKLPEWMETPLMESDAYIFYSAATENPTGTFTVKGYPTTSPKSLDGNVVYVRYDYEKSKKAVESFGMPDLNGLPYNYAPLDLTGEVAYTIGISSNNYGRLWSVNTSTLGISEADVNVNTEMTRVARLWQFTGGDPYEVTIKNPSYSTTEVLAGRVPTDGPAATNAKGEVIKPNTVYPLVKMMNPESPAEAEYTLYTFMVLKYNPKEVTAKIGNVEHSAGALKFYVTSNDHLYMAQSNSLAGGVYIYKDASSYKERLDASGEPINPKNGTMIIYSSFFYRPVLTYHVITNDGKEALKGYSQMAGTTVEMPQMYQSPLLNSSDFSYYTAATETAGTYTVTESTKMAASTAILGQRGGTRPERRPKQAEPGRHMVHHCQLPKPLERQ